MLVAICANYKKLLYTPILLMTAVSLYGYMSIPMGYSLQDNQAYKYITFLNQNNLSYGYGSFWGMNMSVNWLSNGSIHITPVYFKSTTGSVNFKNVRVQTLATWHTKNFINLQPKRQFISISKGASGDRCKDVNICVLGVQRQLGKADEILTYSGMTFLVYNHPIETGL
jgi:hypothetical protein